MTEEELEKLCLDWFREGGWDIWYGPDIAVTPTWRHMNEI